MCFTLHFQETEEVEEDFYVDLHLYCVIDTQMLYYSSRILSGQELLLIESLRKTTYYGAVQFISLFILTVVNKTSTVIASYGSQVVTRITDKYYFNEVQHWTNNTRVYYSALSRCSVVY